MTTPIYANHWLKIHPYSASQPSDKYFVELARKLQQACPAQEIPEPVRQKIALYTAAYLEDQISELGLWRSFTSQHQQLYGSPLPFYPVGDDYLPDEVNREDICFLIWNSWQKSLPSHEYIYPLREEIIRTADSLYDILIRAYETAPENEFLSGLFDECADLHEADRKLTWLFGHSYLTEPSMLPYINQVKAADRFIVPTGPLALFLHEWLPLLTSHTERWKNIEGLWPEQPALPENIRLRNEEIYTNFTTSTGGKSVVYLCRYEELRRFLTQNLRWPDDENHTLPQMKAYRNFVLLTRPGKGVLLAKDIAEYIGDPCNPIYDKERARQNAFRLLTEETLCPPDLLSHCIGHGFLSDAVIPGTTDNGLVARNADFMARHALLYYYRGD